MKTFDFFPTVQSRIWAGIFFFTGMMILLAWIIINEPTRMEEFTDRFEGRSVENGADLFEANCATCHGLQGQGIPNAGPALNNPKLLEFSFFEEIDSELEAVERQLNDDEANGFRLLSEEERAELEAERQALLNERRDLEERLLYWYEPEHATEQAALVETQLDAMLQMNTAAIPEVIETEDGETVDIPAILEENGIQVHSLTASINPEYLLQLTEEAGENPSDAQVAELTAGLTAAEAYVDEDGNITAESFMDWHSQIETARSSAEAAQENFETAFDEAAQELGVAPEDLERLHERLNFAQTSANQAQSSFDNMYTQLEEEFGAAAERIDSMRDELRAAQVAIDEAREARLAALDAVSAAPDDATDEELAALEETSAQATAAFEDAETAYDDLLETLATEFDSTPERVDEVYNQLESDATSVDTFEALVEEIAADVDVTSERLLELNAELNTLQTEAQSAEDNILSVANGIVRTAEITVTTEELESLLAELREVQSETFLPEVMALDELVSEITAMVNLAPVTPARLVARGSILENDLATLTEAEVPDPVIEFKQEEVDLHTALDADITGAFDRFSRFDRLVMAHNQVQVLREEVNMLEDQLAEVPESETATYNVVDQMIEMESVALETQETVRADTHTEMTELLYIVPYSPMPYQPNPNENPDHMAALYRTVQLNWSGTLDSLLETTLISGRPGSGANWSGSEGMVSWAQAGGGPLRPDQVKNLVNYILNWDREFTIADVRKIQQYALVPGEGTGGGGDGGTPIGTDVEAILMTIEEEGLEGSRAAGEVHFTNYGCAGCHQPNQDGQGPALAGLMLRAEGHVGETIDGLDIETPQHYLVQSIVNPNAFVVDGFSSGVMNQNFGTVQITDHQVIADILAYLSQYN